VIPNDQTKDIIRAGQPARIFRFADAWFRRTFVLANLRFTESSLHRRDIAAVGFARANGPRRG
jgi:hypothetical protein